MSETPWTVPVRPAGYVRISKDWKKTGLGIERQRADILAKCKMMGWPEPVKWFEDNDIGAWSGKPRPGYDALMAAVQTGEIDGVAVYSQERWVRRNWQLEEAIKILDDHKTALLSAGGHIDLSTPEGRLQARTVGSAAMYEMETKSRRQKAANIQAAQMGTYSQRTRPFGWNRDDTLNTTEAELIRTGYRGLLDGTASIRSLVRSWNAQGILTTRNAGKRQWTHASMRALFLRPRNCGRSVYLGEVVGKGTWEPVIDEDTFDAVTALLTDPSRKTLGDTTKKHLLSNLMVCGCGGDIIAGSKNQWGTAQYRCRTCARGISSEIADEVVVNWISETLALGSRKKLLALAGVDDITRIAAIRSELAQITKDEEELSAADVGLTLKISEGKKLQARRGPLQDELAVLEQANTLLKLLTAVLPPEGRKVKDLRASVYATMADFQAMDLEQQRTVIRGLVTIRLEPGKFGEKDPYRIAERVVVEDHPELGHLVSHGVALLPLKAGRKPKKDTSSGKSKEELRQVRLWAREQGLPVSDDGRIKKSVLEAYDNR